MGGGVLLPKAIARSVIRDDGMRRGFEGDALDDFVSILIGIDDLYVEVQTRRVAKEARDAANTTNKRR